MAVLIKENVGENLDDTKHELLRWHPINGNLIAISSSNPKFGGQINFFTHKGVKSDLTPIARSDCKILNFSWHPQLLWIAVVWSTGVVTIHNLNAQTEIALPIEKVESKCICWSGKQITICVSSSKDNSVALYTLEHNKSITIKSIKNTQIDEKSNCLCQCTVPQRSLQDDPISNGPSQSDASSLLQSTVEDGFVIGGSNGGIYMFDEDGQSQKVFQLECAIVQLMYLAEKQLLLAVQVDLFLLQLNLINGQQLEEKMRVKLPGKWPNFQMITLEPGILGICSSDRDLRIWDLNAEDNGSLKLRSTKGFSETEVIQCISYSKIKGCLSGGTTEGRVATWKRQPTKSESIEGQWNLQEAITIDQPIKCLEWSELTDVLAVSTGKSVIFISEQAVLCNLNANLAAIQTGARQCIVIRIDPHDQFELQLPISIKGITISSKNVVIWDQHQAFLYSVTDVAEASLKIQVDANFSCQQPSCVRVYQQNIYCLEGDKINVRTSQGTIKQIITLPESEGIPISLTTSGSWLCAATSAGFIRIYDLTAREARQQYQSKNAAEVVPNFKGFSKVQLNKSGNRVSFTCLQTNDNVYPCIMVWDADSDNISTFNFATGLTDQQQDEADLDVVHTAGQRPNTAFIQKIKKAQVRYSLPEHVPGNHHWDTNDDRFLICEAINPAKPINEGNNYLLSIFVTTEDGLHMQDMQIRPHWAHFLIGCSVPYLYYLKTMDQDVGNDSDDNLKDIGGGLIQQVFREFIGVQHCEVATKEAMMNFSYFLTVGKMDEAFKAIKFIKSESVWEHMAHMCVKTRRIDVAMVCLGNMGHARGARVLRQSVSDGDPLEIQTANLALELGLLDDAQALFASCGRYDLVNRLLQTRNMWNQAFEVAEKHDRINLRNTHYNYAKYLESLGAVENAIVNFEKSETHKFEVPRLLSNDISVLENYVKKVKDPDLIKWWAQYLESLQEYHAAKAYYMNAKDYLSAVRVLCYLGNVDEAIEVANSSGDRAAYFHLAQHFEAQNEPQKAVEYFTKARACSNALRLCREHGMHDKIGNLALMAGGNELMDAAQHYEAIPGSADKAVMLYHKAGLIGRALDLAFRTEQFGALDLILKDLDESTDKAILERAALFFSTNQQYEKAVKLMALTKSYSDAIELCERKNVPLSESLAEALTPTKDEMPNSKERKQLIERIAQCCLEQRNYHYAAKKYTQSGNKLQAMQSLIKSGDTQKIIFFANTARDRNIYLLAGNYLQTLDWKKDEELSKKIVQFYNKANAHEHLANFYQACAQVEIEVYHDYAKASEALIAAQHCLAKTSDQADGISGSQSAIDDRSVEISHRIANIKKFLRIQTMYENDPTEAIHQLELMIDQQRQSDLTVQVGDIFAVLIVHNYRNDNYTKAYSLIKQLKQQYPAITLDEFVDEKILNEICQKLDVPSVVSGEHHRSTEDLSESDDVDYSYKMKQWIKRDSLNGK